MFESTASTVISETSYSVVLENMPIRNRIVAIGQLRLYITSPSLYKCGQCIDSLDEPQTEELRRKHAVVHVVFNSKDRLHFRQAESFQNKCTKQPASADIPSWQRCSD